MRAWLDEVITKGVLLKVIPVVQFLLHSSASYLPGVNILLLHILMLT
jgi:hypothetical protein